MRKNLGKILLIVLPIIAAIFMLLPTYQAEVLKDKENAALSEAKKLAQSGKETAKADSVSRMDEFYNTYGEALQNAKNKALKLGLDLRGGMYVTLEVDVVKLIKESAIKETLDDVFYQVLDKTREDEKTTSEPTLDVFLKNFDEIAKPKGKSLISYFDVVDFKEASEEKIIKRLEENANQAIEQAQEVIRQRIDKYGVSEPNIQKQGTRRILLELPGVTNETEMRQLLQTTARLEFKLLRNNQDIVKVFYKIDKLLSNQAKRRKGLLVDEANKSSSDTTVSDTTVTVSEAVKVKADGEVAEIVTDSVNIETTEGDSSEVAATDSASKAKLDTNDPYAGLTDEEKQDKYLAEHPFTSLFVSYFNPGEKQDPVQVSYISDDFPDGQYFFRIYKQALGKFNEILSRPEVKALIPYDIQIAVSAKPDARMKKANKVEILDLYALKAEPELTGDVITDARVDFDPATNSPTVSMTMNAEGTERWAVITGANLKKRIAIVLDDRVYSAPTVQSKITGGSSQITGMGNVEEANLLKIVLKAGALKAPVQIIEERIVGPSLGRDSIVSGLNASALAFILVILYMIIYYGKGGMVADFAIILNVVLIIAVLSAFNGTLTLPGIAGIILTIGMAVDANILIFERIREELVKGRSLRSAIDEGFNKALSAILDSNITTGMTGIILFYFGSGPIQGFALTLIIGIFGTLFTGIMVSRAVIELSISGGATHFSFGQPKTIQG